ncbi:hypothetical protein CMO93_01175 [Candidatus Woesearchaeota archaeon]|nr:hypothetical protein [Candidatus Woesearchaeota archaeon]|tara:strand:+ start:12104 stop:12301 length:198 start_codon:yes stop_codon:yes gene_type:complete
MKAPQALRQKNDYDAALEVVLETDLTQERHASALLTKVNGFYQNCLEFYNNSMNKLFNKTYREMR